MLIVNLIASNFEYIAVLRPVSQPLVLSQNLLNSGDAVIYSRTSCQTHSPCDASF